MYDEFVARGWEISDIIIFVKPKGMPPADRELCETLEKIGEIVNQIMYYFKM